MAQKVHSQAFISNLTFPEKAQVISEVQWKHFAFDKKKTKPPKKKEVGLSSPEAKQIDLESDNRLWGEEKFFFTFFWAYSDPSLSKT